MYPFKADGNGNKREFSTNIDGIMSSFFTYLGINTLKTLAQGGLELSAPLQILLEIFRTIVERHSTTFKLEYATIHPCKRVEHFP